jgi:class 3 adenylate cyclase/tetratricopeptide (TPR) repeat protein
MGEAPTGTVCLMFTDIQGPTALWERYGDGFQDMLGMHHAVIRKQIAKHQAYEVKTEGDAFMIAFPSAASAVHFALHTQLALHQAEWPAQLIEDTLPIEAARTTPDGSFRGLRVRMGLHIGTPTCSPDPTTGRMDYLGRMVNKTGRLRRAAHGGQILLSARCMERVKNDLDQENFHLLNLGNHALRGLSGEEAIHQVLPASLSKRHFPPIQTERRRHTNLSRTASLLLGRKNELQALDEHLKTGTRLISLIGPQGVGKSAIANRFGFDRAEAFPGGVWACNLAEAEDRGDVCAVVAEALGIHLSTQDPVQHIANSLLGRDTLLLILRHVDHLIELVPDTFMVWLGRAPDLHIMTTASTPLMVNTEQVVPIDPLPVPGCDEEDRALNENAAVLLLGNSAHQPKAPLQYMSSLARILDGLPAALVWTGLRAQYRPWPAILADLEERTTPPSGQAPERRDVLGISLRAAIDDLSEDRKTQLAQLSVFQGSFSLPAAGAVIGPEAPEAIDELVKRGLLIGTTPGRQSMTPLIQDHGAGVLSQSKRLRETEEQHGAWFARFGHADSLDQLHHRNGNGGLSLLMRDRLNLRAAAIRAMDRGDGAIAGPTTAAWITVLHWVGPVAAALGPANRVLSMEGLTPQTQMMLFRLRAMSHHVAENHADADTDLTAASRLAKECDDSLQLGRALLDRGLQYCDRGLHTEALSSFEEALRVFTEAGHEAGRGSAWGGMANLSAKEGTLDPAQGLYLQALEVHRAVGNRQEEAAVLCNLAIVTTIKGRMAEARELFRDALAIHRELGDHRAEAIVLGNLGDLFLEMDDLTTARHHLEAALLAAREVGDRLIEGCFTGTLGEVAAKEGQLASARSQMARAERLLREECDTYELIKLVCRRGHVERLGRYPERAWTCLKQAEALAAPLGIAPRSKPHQAIVELREVLEQPS